MHREPRMTRINHLSAPIQAQRSKASDEKSCSTTSWPILAGSSVNSASPRVCADPDRRLSCEGPSLRNDQKKRAQAQAMRHWRGGRTSPTHALSDDFFRSLAFALTQGQVSYCKGDTNCSTTCRTRSCPLKRGTTDAICQKRADRGVARNITSERNARCPDASQPFCTPTGTLSNACPDG
jgi:hypothetical protein